MTDETKMEKMAIESREKWGNEYVSSDDDELWDFIYVRACREWSEATGRNGYKEWCERFETLCQYLQTRSVEKVEVEDHCRNILREYRQWLKESK